MQGFMSHARSELELPDRGVVLVTGPNGAGKSSIVEAVVWGLFGQTLRGAKPFTDGDECRVNLYVENTYVDRVRSKSGKTQLLFADVDAVPVEYETATKAQDALSRVVGSMSVWHRTRAFSSQDAAHFTLATDAERKRLLESILGLERFDDALDSCREDMRAVEINQRETATMADKLAFSIDVRRNQLRIAREGLEGLHELSPVDDRKVEEMERARASCDRDLEGLQDRIDQLNRDCGRSKSELELSRELLQRIQRDGRCAACGQDIPVGLRKRLAQRVSDDEQKASAASQRYVKEASQLHAQIEDLRREGRELSAKQRIMTEARLLHHEQAKERARWLRVVVEAEKAIAQEEQRMRRFEDRSAEQERRVATFGSVHRVLGLKGFRAHVLDRALSGVEEAANAWLFKFGATMSVQLKSWGEKSDGGVSDSISLVVATGHGELPYAACSGGERRRVDVALLLALAEVSGAALGTGGSGTLFFDECFDSLDEQGTDAIAQSLQELGADRCVVVISHSDALADRLQPALRLRVDGGRIA